MTCLRCRPGYVCPRCVALHPRSYVPPGRTLRVLDVDSGEHHETTLVDFIVDNAEHEDVVEVALALDVGASDAVGMGFRITRLT